MSIKTNFELPRGNSEDDVLLQGQRLSRDLSKNFKSINKQLKNNQELLQASSFGLDGVIVLQSFSSATGSLFQTFTINHSLGAVPRGFLITDINIPNPVVTNALDYSIFRISWTDTQIVVRLNIETGTTNAFAGTFSILLLR